ncbi:MAG: hypothetical protein FJ104_02875, partial [Deltaproteobacteria bacterium]|nr:hypothetical protein [Deltaproteobacteria bacterium]
MRAAAEEGYQGVVEFEERLLGFESGGRLREVPAVRGAWVAPGAPLASLDPTLTRMASELRASEVEAASAQLALLQKGARGEEICAMDAQVRAARASEELLEKSLGREQALLARGASTEAVAEDLAGRLARSRAEREALGQKLAALQRGSRREELTAAEARLAGA